MGDLFYLPLIKNTNCIIERQKKKPLKSKAVFDFAIVYLTL